MGVQLPSLAALGVLVVFVQTGVWIDGGNLGWPFGVCLVTGAVVASAFVRRVGLWTVAPAPPVVFVVLAVGNAAWQRQSQRQAMWASGKEFAADAVPWFVNGFPWLAVAVGTAVAVALVRVLSGGKAKCRSSSTGTAGDG
ncbi:hypothetical protein SAMN05216553_12058 [Lentzea fradiae]|uniref:DUF6542 domain-containing protein n=1 Tax=Lentzea fradiae TaxID=200378 RepID=A0A1G8BUD6_9PSEU|nr:DUF6542 domain-containing protein [Lentzea fradiae]SDH36787.1 hypothetical protein SAMN05216553_12058 [Lentzea fradiae]